MDRNKGEDTPSTRKQMQVRQQREERLGRRYSRPPLMRMVRLHEWLIANRYPNCRKIAEEFEVSSKTVQRNVNFMRDQMGMPIEYDMERFGFRYTQPVMEFPALGFYSTKPPGKEGNWARVKPPPPLGQLPDLMARGGRGSMVRICFDAESAQAARSRTWHATQATRSLPEGGLEMALRVPDEEEIVRWVLGWSGHAWVIEPQRLRIRLKEVALEILAHH